MASQGLPDQILVGVYPGSGGEHLFKPLALGFSSLVGIPRNGGDRWVDRVGLWQGEGFPQLKTIPPLVSVDEDLWARTEPVPGPAGR